MIRKNVCIVFMAYLFTGLLILLGASPCCAQVKGCNDPLANNYNPLATENDGSCTYQPASYTPAVKVDPINAILSESSGLQMAGNFLWSFNDGGGAAAIYRIDTLSGSLLQTVNLAGAENIDWEDIAFDGLNFYIGDFGNNADGARTNLKIYKFPLSAIPAPVGNAVATIPAAEIAIINFSYSDQPQPPQPTTNNNTKFDCEAMIVDGGKIHLFTKNWIELTTTHYVINGLTSGTYNASPVETLATGYLVTAADKAAGKNIIALLGYAKTGLGDHFMHLLTDYNGGNYFNGNKRQINLPNALVMGQAEGICFRTATDGYISNENVFHFPFLIAAKLRSFTIGGFVSATAPLYVFGGSGNWTVPANWSNNIVPPAIMVAGSEIVIDPAPGGKCILNIPYTVSPGAKLTIIAAKGFLVQGNLTVQ